VSARELLISSLAGLKDYLEPESKIPRENAIKDLGRRLSLQVGFSLSERLILCKMTRIEARQEASL
jgi:hypothetical protein